MIDVDCEELAQFLLGIYWDLQEGNCSSMDDLEKIFKEHPQYFHDVGGSEWHFKPELYADGYFDDKEE